VFALVSFAWRPGRTPARPYIRQGKSKFTFNCGLFQ
jgi:hypothetical protein